MTLSAPLASRERPSAPHPLIVALSIARAEAPDQTLRHAHHQVELCIAAALVMSLTLSLTSCAYQWGAPAQQPSAVKQGGRPNRALSLPVRSRGVSAPVMAHVSACVIEGALQRGVEVAQLEGLISSGATLWVSRSALSPHISELSLCLKLNAPQALSLEPSLASSLRSCDLQRSRLIEGSSVGVSALDEGLERALSSLCESLSEALSELLLTQPSAPSKGEAL